MRALMLVLILAIPVSVVADSWSFLPELEATEYVFGATRVVRVVDAREDQTYPDFRIDVFTDGELVGRYGGQYFEDIAASDNNHLFVAISNRGIPYTAIILFDSEGNLRSLVNHNIGSGKLDYCFQSITWERNWYDAEAPELRFIESNGGSDIQVRDCRGDIVLISEMLQ